MILDRYFYSGVVYAMASGLPANWLMSLDAGLPRPSVVFLLERSVTGLGDEKYETVEFQKRATSMFRTFMAGSGDKWIRISADKSIDDVLAELAGHVRQFGNK